MITNKIFFTAKRRFKLMRAFRIAIRQFYYALRAYRKFSSIIASDARTKAISGRAISVCEAVIANNNNNVDDDNINHSVSDINNNFSLTS